MNRLLRMSFVAALASLAFPVAAMARDNQITPLGLHLAVSATGLAVAIALLIEALGLRKVAFGGAVAEKMHYVILAIVCLAASALAKWTSNFVDGVTFEQTELASELLVVLGMALLAGYFYSVRTAMQAFLRGMTAEQAEQAEAHAVAAAAAESAETAEDGAEPRG